MQGAQKLRSEAYVQVRCNDEGEAQRRRWTFYETIKFHGEEGARMKSVKGAKKAAKKAGKIATKAMAKGTKTLAAVKKKVVKTVSKAETQTKAALEDRTRKISAQKDALIKKLMEDLSAKEKLLKENKKGLFDKAKENLLELKSRAEARPRNGKQSWNRKEKFSWR